MEKINAMEKEWIKSLTSLDPIRILPALYEIRNSGSVKLLPVMLKLVNKETNQQVRNEILKLISETKSQEAVPLIVESIENLDFGDYLPNLVAACWQSGLDFSKYLLVFAGIFIRADYISSLESFTLIEESIPNASDTDIYKCKSFLKDAECMVTDEKLPLFRELRKVVESI
jgi:HEAT repeat protein